MAKPIKVTIMGDATDFSKATEKAEASVTELDKKISAKAASSADAMEKFSKKSRTAVGDFDAKVKTSADKADRNMSKFGDAAKKTGEMVTAGFAIAAYAVANFVTDGIADIMRWDEINTQTRVTVESTGGSAKVSAKHINKYAEGIEALTGIEAETVQEGANVLLAFENIRNELGEGNNIFDQTTNAMVDMAKKMGIDPTAAAKLLGKALNDPIKGMGGLAKAGIKLDDAQKEQVKSLMEQGDILGAQKVILDEVNEKVQGSATAWGQTMPGQVAKAQNAYGNLKEELALSLMPTLLTVSTWLQKTAPGAIDKFKEKWEGWQPTIQANVADFKQGWSDFMEGIDSFRAGWQLAIDPQIDIMRENFKVWQSDFSAGAADFATGWDLVTLHLHNFKENFKAGYKEIDDNLTRGGQVLWGWVVEFQLGCDTVYAKWTEFTDQFKAGYKEIDDNFTRGAQVLWGWVVDFQTGCDAVYLKWTEFKDNFKLGVKEIGDAASGAWDTVTGIPGGLIPNMPGKPRAMGGPASGMVSVGERGPENVILPRGSRVVPNHASGGGNVTVNVTHPRASAGEIAAALAWTMKTSGR